MFLHISCCLETFHKPFKSKYSTTDLIHAINQTKEKCLEYNIPLCVAFVDYEESVPILTSLQSHGIEDGCIEIMKSITTGSNSTHMHKENGQIRIKRGVRQGDIISPSCSRQHWRAYLEG